MHTLAILSRLQTLIHYNMTKRELEEAQQLIDDLIAMAKNPNVSRSRF